MPYIWAMDETTLEALLNPGENGYAKEQVESLVNAYKKAIQDFTEYQSVSSAKVKTVEELNKQMADENVKLKAKNFDLISQAPAEQEKVPAKDNAINGIDDLFEEVD